MDKKLAEKIVEVVSDSDIFARIYEDYSGRGAFGKATTGVVCNSFGDVLAAVISNAGEFCEDEDGGYPEAIFNVDNLRMDSLGLSTIIY
jgi:hypothetical protein